MINAKSKRRGKHAAAELNMAPLIDMVFILLIFFLATTSFVKESGIDVNRPTAATAVSRPKASIMVAIDSQNRVFMESHEIDVRAVRANVERSLAENPEGAVVVVADSETDTGTTVMVMDGCRLAGASSVSLAATPPEGR